MKYSATQQQFFGIQNLINFEEEIAQIQLHSDFRNNVAANPEHSQTESVRYSQTTIENPSSGK